MLNPELVISSIIPIPYFDCKNQIKQDETKIEKLGKQYISEIDGLKQQIDRLINKLKKP